MRTVSKKSSRSFPSKKIRSVVQSVLPKGRKFRLQVLDSKIGNMKIVRVVTPAWKTLSPSERIHKLILAANEELTRDEIKNILRFSVLTPDEYSRIIPRKSVKNGNLVQK